MSASLGRGNETLVSDNTIYRALTAIAAVIEEPHCVVGPDELHALVDAHSKLCNALGVELDYLYADGKAVVRRERGCTVKTPCVAPRNGALRLNVSIGARYA